MVHYDGNIQPHMHFMCNCCQTIYDLDNNDEKLLNNLKKRTSIILMLLISICQVSVKNV